MKTSTKIIGLSILLIMAAALLYAYYVLNKPHRDIVSAKPDVCCEAAKLYREFKQNENEANARYINKVLQVTGRVQFIERNHDSCLVIVLSSDNGEDIDINNMLDFPGGISCTFVKAEISVPLPEIGDKVTIKGLCTGKTMDVVLIECSFSNNK